jgi:hypothetical protein
VLSRLIVSPCFRLDPDFYQAVTNIRAELDQEDTEGERSTTGRLRFIVIDQITSLFKDQLVNTNSAGEALVPVIIYALIVGQAAMIGVLEDISEMTYTHNLTTIVSRAVFTEGSADDRSSMPTLRAYRQTPTHDSLRLLSNLLSDPHLRFSQTRRSSCKRRGNCLE